MSVYFSEEVKGREHLEDLGVDGKTNLDWREIWSG
jgi:hypothetical protein